MDEHDSHDDPPAGPRPGVRGGVPRSGECQDALDTLYHFLDGELDEERREAIQVHLDRCSSCLEAFDFEAELKLVVAQRCRETVPEHLRRRVAEALADASKGFRGPV
jgi:mycothiol system anti-sigma-R factor